MSELLKVGIFAAVSVAITATVIAWFGGPVWYAIGPFLVFTAYVLKFTLTKRRDDPRAVRAVILMVSVAMIMFAWFNRIGSI